MPTNSERRIWELETIASIRDNLHRELQRLRERDESEDLVDAVTDLTNLVSHLLVHSHHSTGEVVY